MTARDYYAEPMTAAELKAARAAGNRPQAPGADLRWADLYGANLYGADLYGANLRGADLRGADLRWADLYGANLYGANLRGADLRGADLRGADLRGANLHGANLHGANLRWADLYGAKLRGILTDTNPPDLIGTSDAAKILRVTSVTVTRWAASGDLTPAGRLGSGAFVFNRIDVEKLAAERESAAAEVVVSPSGADARSVF